MHLTRRIAALVLTAAAIAVPCTAWYVAGSRAAAREAADLERTARQGAMNTALRLAERLAGRLEAIRLAESSRPPYHYQHLYHDPTSTCACASVTPSPLADGPNDPLIWTHFQIDGIDGFERVTLPTLHAEFAAQSDPLWTAEQVRIASVLEPEAEALTAALGLPIAQEAADWAGGFEWRTVPIGGSPQLVALRRADTPDGDLILGLVISRTGVAQSLSQGPLPARFVTAEEPALEETEIAVAVPIECVSWWVAVDAGEAMAAAREHGGEVKARFRRNFLWGTGAALVAGFSVVGLLWQTDRLARQRSRFAAAAAHELRTPLTGLRVYAEMLAQGLGDPARTREYANVMAGEAERLGRVVSNVLDYSRLERSSLRVRPEAGDLGAAVHGCLERLRPAVESAGARLECQIAEGLPAVRFDPDAVFHIIQNLLDNAEKYSRGAADRTIRVRLAPGRGGGVTLAVADRGPGIPAERQRHLFRPFKRAVDPNAPPGLGLGLTLVHNLIRAHGGLVTCENPPEGGATFTVSFPA
jgi:signal transduction histidine kinase